MSGVMRVTVCEWDSRPEMLEAQLQALQEHCAMAGSEFVLLPEMPFDDWLSQNETPDQDRWQLSVQRHLEWIDQLKRLPDCEIVATMPTADSNGRRHNRGFVRTLNSGRTDIHDKIHLPDEDGYREARWYHPGIGNFETVETSRCRLGMLICSELWFIEHARRYGRDGAHLLCVPRATPTLGNDGWMAAGRTAAIVSGSYCLSSNQTRPYESGFEMGGCGWVIDPEGAVLATTTPNTPFVTVDVDLDHSEAAKLTYPRYIN
ncbi:MAG: nitrilase [Blastopirellula sp.]|nr:MAG: nitrilase [Blastopirellula sp.]